MPFTDPAPKHSGRNSRASNVSGNTGASRSVRSPPPGNDMLANAGVLSMLKTGTDTGDIGALSFNSSRLPSMPARAQQKRQQHARLSGPFRDHQPHHHYAPSVRSGVSSNTRDWDATSNGRRGSMTSMQTLPPPMPERRPPSLGGINRPPSTGPPPAGERPGDSRSYSMTNMQPPNALPSHRSATSLKSAGHEPRRYNGPPPPMPENRGPYMYPARLKRPGYRSPSPALNDSYVQVPHPPPPTHMVRRVPIPMARPLLQTYNGEYNGECGQDPRHLNVRAPPRAMPYPPPPPMSYEQPQFSYHPGPMRSAPSLPLPQPSQRPPPHQGYGTQQQYGPPRPTYHLGQYPIQYPGQRGPPPPPAGPMAHNIFHNAARMARQLPQRTDTPLTATGPPSSDPPSSSTAPTSSSPPTPRDHTPFQVVVDPVFVDPALIDLQDSPSEPVLPAQYFQYVEGLEKAAEEPAIEPHYPSQPPFGFVQRVKAMLESRAAVEAAAKKAVEREHLHEETHAPSPLPAEEEDEVHELAADHTPRVTVIEERVTVIEEFHAPVELPASPVKVAELEASPAKPAKRITRALVKAELAPSSNENDSSVPAETDVTLSNFEDQTHHRVCSDRTECDENESATPTDTAGSGDVPSSPPSLRERKTPVIESAELSSPDMTRVSGIDYALRFSMPADSTTMEVTETESRDPFMLDADTITVQHQEAKTIAATPEPSTARDTLPFPATPVSPIRPGEDANRYSAVSPMHTQTLGIDETLCIGSDTKQSDTEDRNEPAMPGSFPEEPQQPPTPRTAKTYSKSVQLTKPNFTVTYIDNSTTTNRLSLPPDLSQIGDGSMNTTSDILTDVAVRFSMPQTTITMGKPNIVTIPPSSSPPAEELKPPKPALLGPQTKQRRGSVTFEEQVAPLSLHKKSELHRQTHSVGEVATNARRPFSRGPSPFEEQADSERDRDSTTDLRFSGINFIRNKYPSTYLADLKEESVEDMSLHDPKRSSDIANGLQIQLPARIAAVKAMQERRQQEADEKAKMRQARRHRNPPRPLAEIRDLPSLNFSRMDLIDKLNEALQVRSSKSIDVIRRRDFSSIYCPSPQRPQSTEPLRERYTSFFNKPEDFSFFEEDSESDHESDHEVEEVQSRRESRAHGEIDSANRPISPEEHLLQFATQVNRLSIPSVAGLSERLSVLLPSLKHMHLDSILADDNEVANTIGDIHQLGNTGHGIRPDTVMSNRTSAGFRTLAERADEIVRNGTHDSSIPVGRAYGLNKELPPLPESASSAKVSAVNTLDGKLSCLSGSVSAPSDLGKEPMRPMAALLRARAPTSEEEVRQLLPPENNPLHRASKRSLISCAHTSRPWNQDENYPWSSTQLAMDLSIPSEVHQRDSAASRMMIERGTRSLDIARTGDPTDDTTSGIDIGSIHTDLDATASITTEQLTGVSTSHARKPSKLSMIGSIKHKMGLSRSHDDGSKVKSLPTSPGVRSADDHPHVPGDRYPSTGLTPPTALNLDEVRSFFSDDSSEKERKTRGRRWTGLKGKNKHLPEIPRGQSLDGNLLIPHPYDAGSMINDRIFTNNSSHTYDGVGMGKTEFRIKRFGEKLRHLFAKGGELIRSWSVRSRRERGEGETDDWLSDSLYSGV